MEKRLQNRIFRIAVTGPESTGKSELSEQLAKHYKTIFVPEYAREYISQLGREYKYKDLEIIAREQINLQNKAEHKANKILICDTELTVIKIWSEHKFNKCSEWITKNFIKNTYDLYLLCNIDLPWEYDPLREHPHLRKHFFDCYENELRKRDVRYIIISGIGKKRLQNAIKEIEKVFSDFRV
jgi:NadR type nicotinamide-nucleotide adenylyltransferase